MPTIQDQEQRNRALDPRQSFIVQAPAGSGKTELLTQRFLVLLSHVKQPEEILAITFTKKSAAEMRARIINALKNASETPEPTSSHAQKTWRLAKSALKHNETHHWDLLENPSRLRIQTIDSFNVSLTRQLPILSHFGATPEIADKPTEIYREAVQEFLSHLEEDVTWSDAIAQLLIHMDNDLNKVETLLINLLAKRDQWLPYITLNASDPELRKNLEAQLASVVTDILITLNDKFPKKYATQLINLANFAGHNLERDNPESPSTCCAKLISLPGTSAKDKKFWIGLSNLLLTKEFEWRKRVDTNLGFLPPSGSKNAEEKGRLKELQQDMLELIKHLSEHEDLRLCLKELNEAPDPYYQASQWATLNALHQALRVAVAQLTVTFQKYGKIDYTENALAALTALGTEDAPTDITLALDYRIQHILIDEFQDTSTGQYRLLEKLIGGWQDDDGRTLFIVGDPMQSIYRFREAEVGLFIRARKIGIGNVALEPLTLSVNFRSVPGVVNWVNEHFQRVLPPFEDISTGAVSYSSSIAHQTDISNPEPVSLHPFVNAEETTQANKIVSLIKESQQKNPDGDIAILVRSRNHLEFIVPALKNANLSYQAINIDPLTTRPVIQDLMALTKALSHPSDRISWLAILRAPWCALTLSDLLIIAGKKPEQMIWERLHDKEVISALSADGQQRLARFIDILKNKIAERRRHTLRIWVESTWILLGGPACVDQVTDLDDAAAFFKLLEILDNGGDLANSDELENYVNDLFASVNSKTTRGLQIMTIHNAKGLEFDTVILPHLERKSPNDDKQLLLWMERSRQNDSSSFILAPVHAIGDENDSIYEYIKRQNSIKMDYENGRLLYVAATRAKKELHLLFNLKTNENNSSVANPITKSLLEKMWGPIQKNIADKIHVPEVVSEISESKPLRIAKNIKRLALTWKQPLQEINSANISAYNQKNAGYIMPINTPKFIGVLIHQILQQICLNGSAWWLSENTANRTIYVKNNLLQQGIATEDLHDAINHVVKAIHNTLNDERGQWILQSHRENKTEFPVTAVIDEVVKPLIIDRTFVDESGVRWIIDYKTTAFLGDDIEDFLNNEQSKYSQQLWEYHQAMRALDDKPIRVGLYFPLVPAWREWSF